MKDSGFEEPETKPQISFISGSILGYVVEKVCSLLDSLYMLVSV
ncbi:hypothetical protein IGI43_000835 [Enterococcus sp. AZ126]